MSDSEMSEEYEFEYSDEDDMPEDEDVDIVNDYVNAKDNVDRDPTASIEGFERVISQEKEKGQWGFKAHKQLVKLFSRTGQFEQMLSAYRRLLGYMDSVTRNDFEKVLNNVLTFVSTTDSSDVLQELYELTLQALRDAHNDRLWFNTMLQLGKLYFEKRDIPRLHKVLRDLHRSCENPDGTLNDRKDTQLLEVYALEIQLYTEQKNNKKLMALYQKSLQVRSAIPHPKILGIIRECGGKMRMGERMWSEAMTDFFEAFKAYDEAGEPRRINCLKYMVLASLLHQSDINPFDSQEAKPYINDPEIVAMRDLVTAYENADIRSFERTLNNNRKTVMDDPFIRDYIEDLLRNIRSSVLLKLIAPYTRVRISYISEELNIPVDDVEELVVALILDRQIDARIDQFNGLLIMPDKSASVARYRSMDDWATRLSSLAGAITEKVSAMVM